MVSETQITRLSSDSFAPALPAVFWFRRLIARRPGRVGPALLLVVASVLSGILLPGTAAADELDFDERSWQFYWANDILVSSDDQFTNGVALYVHSRTAETLEETTGTPAFGKRLARVFLPRSESLTYRESWGFGQNMQTPGDLSETALILDDIPYVGMLGWTNTFTAMDEKNFTAFQTLIGLVGPAAGAESVQTQVHDWVGDTEPLGWDNQLDNEPLLGLYYMKKRKLLNGTFADFSLSGDAALGNFFSLVQVGAELRLGQRPAGFASIPNPIGRGLNYSGTFGKGPRTAIYSTLGVRGSWIPHALPRDGNTFRDDNSWTEGHTVEREPFVAQGIIGLHFQRPHWGLHLYSWISTDTVSQRAADAPDRDNSFGAFFFECRF